MRLRPPVSKDEAQEWLINSAIATLGAARTPELEKLAASLAEAMAAVSATTVPYGVEPLFP